MNLFQRYLVEEFAEDYQEGHLSRREALKLIAGVTGSVLVANSILAACTPVEEPATTAPPLPTTASASPPAAQADTPTAAAESTDTPTEPPAASTTEPALPETGDIEAMDVEFPGEDTTLLGYLARPGGEGPHPVVLVCHENRGLTEHIRDVTRRLGKAGYVAIAVDLLSRDGGTSRVDPGQVPGKLTANPAQNVADFQSAFRYLQTLNSVQRANIGMVGFCFGGGMTWLTATAIPELKAAVPFYGPPPPTSDVPKINAAVLAIYGELDQRITASAPEIEAAMQENGKTFEKVIYPGANHAFHNDTGDRWNEQAAVDAWQKTLDWFKKYLV